MLYFSHTFCREIRLADCFYNRATKKDIAGGTKACDSHVTHTWAAGVFVVVQHAHFVVRTAFDHLFDDAARVALHFDRAIG